MPPTRPDLPWAKLDRHADDQIRAALPLVEHSLDVAAVATAMLTDGAWGNALEAAAGRPLSEQDVVRLVALTALHDLGKANAGFQARWELRAQKIGHEGQVAALLYDERLAATSAGRALSELRRTWGAGPYLPALMAHHGRPRAEFGAAPLGVPPWQPHVALWRAVGDYDPRAEAMRLIDQVRDRYPLAWAPGDRLPADPRFVSLFAGLVTLADWIGSDTAIFPLQGPYGAARDATRAQRAAEAVSARGLTPLATPPGGFADAFGASFVPRGVQTHAAADDLGAVALIEAETGSGKTEAALWRWLELRRRRLVDGLYFALPTRSAAVQLHARVDEMLERAWGGQGPTAVLAVPGYLRAGDVDGSALPGWEVRWDDDGGGEGGDARWAAERTNRFLAARVAVGTIDQALLAALPVKHAHVRAAALARNLLVVDEVHASDAYMGGLLERLLDNHVRAGGHALLLSATLGGTARARLLKQPAPTLAEALDHPYPALSGSDAKPRQASSEGTRAKQVTVETRAIIDDPDAIAALAITAARAGASVLVVRNTVGGAIAVAQAIEAVAPELAFRVNHVATLHHGRFSPVDRRMLDDAVEQAFGKGRSAAGQILVGTQTLEQSLDIDADLLITDLAPMDVLLQRIGRLHRHERYDRGAFAEARAIVLRPADRDLTMLLDPAQAQHGLGAMRDGRGVYPNLLHLEASLRLIEGDPTLAIPADNRRLVEHALHSEVSARIAGERDAAWRNHAAACNALAFGDRDKAEGLSLDLSTRFDELAFPRSDEEEVSTRLGAQDLLIDFAPAMVGPFGEECARLTIPHWMARGIGGAVAVVLDAGGDGWRFRMGQRCYAYGRWGLLPA